MMDIKELWRKRFQNFITDHIFIIRRIANGFMFLPILLIIFGLYYYPIFLEWLPKAYPVHLSVAGIFAIYNSTTGYRSFLKESDMFYLTPIEMRLKTYFGYTFIYNWLIQGFFLLGLIGILSPLYIDRIDSRIESLFVFTIILWVLKGWNLGIQWNSLKNQSEIISKLYFFIRLIINFMVIYGILSEISMLKIMGIIFAAILTVTQSFILKNNTLNWIRLIEEETRLDSRMNRWISMFVDSHYSAVRVRYKRILPHITKLLAPTAQNSYRYLYLKVFFRNEISGMMIHITLIGMSILLVIPDPYVIIIVYICLMFLVGIQLKAFWEALSNRFWLQIYPLSISLLKKAFIMNTFLLMLIIGLFMSLSIVIRGHSSYILLILIGINGVISFTYCNVYLKQSLINISK